MFKQIVVADFAEYNAYQISVMYHEHQAERIRAFMVKYPDRIPNFVRIHVDRVGAPTKMFSFGYFSNIGEFLIRSSAQTRMPFSVPVGTTLTELLIRTINKAITTGMEFWE